MHNELFLRLEVYKKNEPKGAAAATWSRNLEKKSPKPKTARNPIFDPARSDLIISPPLLFAYWQPNLQEAPFRYLPRMCTLYARLACSVDSCAVNAKPDILHDYRLIIYRLSEGPYSCATRSTTRVIQSLSSSVCWRGTVGRCASRPVRECEM